jgi:hypothetical protein
VRKRKRKRRWRCSPASSRRRRPLAMDGLGRLERGRHREREKGRREELRRAAVLWRRRRRRAGGAGLLPSTRLGLLLQPPRAEHRDREWESSELGFSLGPARWVVLFRPIWPNVRRIGIRRPGRSGAGASRPLGRLWLGPGASGGVYLPHSAPRTQK